MSPSDAPQPNGCPLSQAGVAALVRLLRARVERFPTEPANVDLAPGAGKSWTSVMTVKCENEQSKI